MSEMKEKKKEEEKSGFVPIAFVMYITTTTMCDGVLHCLLWFAFNVFLVPLHGD